MNRRYKRLVCLKQTADLEIWKAMDEVSMQPVLQKTLRHGAPVTLSHQFRMEEQVLSALNSPWIPRLLDLEQTAWGMSLIETWLEGERLDQWLAGRPGYSEKRKVFEQLVDLVHLVHEAGFLYLDLKADNVLIVQGHACLIDFNACVFTGSQHALLSNPDALPPEHARLQLDERADQIGLGRLHQLLFGKGIVGWKCLQNHPDQRFSSLMALKQAVRWLQRPWGLVWMVIFALAGTGTAAFLSAAKKPAAADFVWTESCLPKDLEDASGRLFSDLESDRVTEADLGQEDQAEAMVNLAAASQNGWLARALMQKLAPDLLEGHPLWQLRLYVLSQTPAAPEQVQVWLDEIPFSDQPGKDLAWLALSVQQQPEPEALLGPMMECAACVEVWESEDALLFVQCLLQCAGCSKWELPEKLADSLQDSAQGALLLEFWAVQDQEPVTQGTL